MLADRADAHPPEVVVQAPEIRVPAVDHPSLRCAREQYRTAGFERPSGPSTSLSWAWACANVEIASWRGPSHRRSGTDIEYGMLAVCLRPVTGRGSAVIGIAAVSR